MSELPKFSAEVLRPNTRPIIWAGNDAALVDVISNGLLGDSVRHPFGVEISFTQSPSKLEKVGKIPWLSYANNYFEYRTAAEQYAHTPFGKDEGAIIYALSTKPEWKNYQALIHAAQTVVYRDHVAYTTTREESLRRDQIIPASQLREGQSICYLLGQKEGRYNLEKHKRYLSRNGYIDPIIVEQVSVIQPPEAISSIKDPTEFVFSYTK